jgi:hypothetical protein
MQQPYAAADAAVQKKKKLKKHNTAAAEDAQMRNSRKSDCRTTLEHTQHTPHIFHVSFA